MKAVRHRGSHLQIIASAGSGKTEVVAQRIADLVAEGAEPHSIVAFTFTERAAESLKHRIEQRVEGRLGKAAVDSLSGCFIGTIHAYCYNLLREHVPDYETFDLLDDNKLVAFLTRESNRIDLESINLKLFTAIPDFIRNFDVVENELIPLKWLIPPFSDVLARLDDRLSAYRFFTYGRLISLAVVALRSPSVFAAVHDKLRHLVVDEYQDVNPAQEALIRLLAAAPVQLCVVGDDDQSIYQWRGSSVENIVQFANRNKNVAAFRLLTNRRSRPNIVSAANKFATLIEGRLQKEMTHTREGAHPELVTWRAATESEEASLIARTIVQMRARGYRYRDMAVLVRSSTSYKCLLSAFENEGVPVQPGGRTGLFLEADAQAFGRTFSYLADHQWRVGSYGFGSAVSLDSLADEYASLFKLDNARKQRVRRRLENWKKEVKTPTGPADLIGQYYDLLADCGLALWDFSDPLTVARLGNLARCSAILADFESVRRRSRADEKAPGEIVGGQDRGDRYYMWLAIHIQNWAQGAFEGFEGEDNFTLDAVDLTTIHKSKGLEWPIVFVPCVSAQRFPSRNTGRAQQWMVPLDMFDRTRYEGTENDERRLFYVALTRARDWLSVSTHDTPNKRAVRVSPFLLALAGGAPDHLDSLPLPPPTTPAAEAEDMLSITFSELASYKTCALSYRLRNLIGFQPSLSPELGFGNAVHHIMRSVAEFTRKNGRTPSSDQLNLIFDEGFYLPAANKAGHREMKASARKLVEKYISDHKDDLYRIWAVERPFELHLPSAIVAGRADVILEEEDHGGRTSLAIVDYKTSTNGSQDFDYQLQIYADAGRREGLDIRAAYVHDLKEGKRHEVDISESALRGTEADANEMVDRLKARRFDPNPGAACKGCDVRKLCSHAPAKASIAAL